MLALTIRGRGLRPGAARAGAVGRRGGKRLVAAKPNGRSRTHRRDRAVGPTDCSLGRRPSGQAPGLDSPTDIQAPEGATQLAPSRATCLSALASGGGCRLYWIYVGASNRGRGEKGSAVPGGERTRTDTENGIAVGTGLSARPPHRSVREELPHTAPTSGHNASRSLGYGCRTLAGGIHVAISRFIRCQFSFCPF